MSSNRPFWMVRAGEGAYLADEFKQKKLIAIGWEDLDDISSVSSPEELKTLVKETYPLLKPGQIAASTGQLIRFKFEFQKGDNVITYNSQQRVYLVGEIIGDYQYKPVIAGYPNIRTVKWIGEVERDRLTTSSKNTLGAISTIFKLSDDVASEILSLLTGSPAIQENSDNYASELNTMRDDMLLKAHEFIKDGIIKLNWDELQHLMAGILRAMGYKTTVSKGGPDRGKDIIASPDGLGLEDPRIVVEVKHQKKQISSKEIRGFTGGLRSGHKGLYVSTGGFSKEARYEADRSTIPLTLVDMDSLVELTVQYYENMDVDTKMLIPLVKIYWPRPM